MNNKGIGSIFCLIAAILMAARYMAAAMFMSNVSSWDAGLFASGLEYIGPELKIASIIALIVGIVSGTYSSVCIAGPLCVNLRKIGSGKKPAKA